MRKYCAGVMLMAGSWMAFGAGAVADPCTFQLYGTDSMMYMDAATGGKKVDKITIPGSCKAYTVHLRHAGTLPLAAMGHNWLLVDPVHFNDINSSAISAGTTGHYLPKDRTNLLAGSTMLLGGGANEPKDEKIAVDTSKLTKGKSYKGFCSFPGHFAMMSMEVVVQ